MDLKCKIGNEEFKITQGVSFSEEYNETLDSGSVIITTDKKLDIKPYDDVFFYDNEFNGYNQRKYDIVNNFKSFIEKENEKLYVKIDKDLLNIDFDNIDLSKTFCYSSVFTKKPSKSFTLNDGNLEKIDFFADVPLYGFKYFQTNGFIYILGGFKKENNAPNLNIYRLNNYYGGNNEVSVYYDLSDFENIEYYYAMNKVVYDYKNDEIYFTLNIGGIKNNKLARIDFGNKTFEIVYNSVIGVEKISSVCYYNDYIYMFYTTQSVGTEGIETRISLDCYNVSTKKSNSVDLGLLTEDDILNSLDSPITYCYCSFDENSNSSSIFGYSNGKLYKMPFISSTSIDGTNTIQVGPTEDFYPICPPFLIGGDSADINLNFSNVIWEDEEKTYILKASTGELQTTTNHKNTSFDTGFNLSFYSVVTPVGKRYHIFYDYEIKETETKEEFLHITSFEKQDNSLVFNIEESSLGIPSKYVFTLNGDYLVYEFDGDYRIINDLAFSLEINTKYETIVDPSKTNNFYKHLLIDSINEEILSLTDSKYRYRIALFSETKGLETIALPNRAITQPLNGEKKKNIYEYAKEFLSLYGPKKKVYSIKDSNIWQMVDKYTLDPNLEEIFKDTISPDFSENSPSLRDMLSKLFIVKDRIPVVKDDVIYAMDITERKGNFDLTKGQINYITSTLTSSNYCNSLRKNYNEGLSQTGSSRYVEYLGFRNSDEALMTLENMRVETKFPIYKINKIYVCYYKKIGILNKTQEEKYESKIFLCKQDITPLVKLNSERNLLSQDWDDFNNFSSSGSPKDIEEMAKYKLCTVGYDIGSTYITGWGTKYEYPNFWWTKEATYIENILSYLDKKYPYGIYEVGYLTRLLNDVMPGDQIVISNVGSNIFDSMVSVNSAIDQKYNNVTKMKSLFFMIDYQSFYSGTVIHSKNIDDKNITINDNPSASLSLLEADGLYTTEKLNRYGNKNISIPARYTDIKDLQELGSVYNNGNDTDVVIYHREYSIYDNVINCNYYGSKDYVLKNYFTTVWAKHRTYNLMSYGESIRRAENKKMFLLLSKKTSYFEFPSNGFNFENFSDFSFLQKILSFFKQGKEATTIDFFEDTERINYALIKHKDNYYSTDVNAFVSGYSLCLNLNMYDNIMAGVYIKKFLPYEDRNWIDIIIPGTDEVKDDYTGSVQGWLKLIDDDETGQTKNLGFYFGYLDQSKIFNDFVIDDNEENKNLISNIYNDILFKMPKINSSIYYMKNKIGLEMEVNKDNKERIDMTFQFEPITDDENIMFSQWMMKLSDLITPYHKTYYTYSKVDSNLSSKFFEICASTTWVNRGGDTNECPIAFLRVEKEIFDNLQNGQKILSGEMAWNEDVQNILHKLQNSLVGFSYILDTIVEKNKDYLIVSGSQRLKVDYSFAGPTFTEVNFDVQTNFKKVTDYNGAELDNDKYYYFMKIWDGISYVDSNGKSRSIRFQDMACSNGCKMQVPGVGYVGVNEQTCYITKAFLDGEENLERKTYYQNMFFVYKNEKMKKTTVYDEIYYENFNSEFSFEFDFIDEDENIKMSIIEEENKPFKLRALIKKEKLVKNEEQNSYGSIRLYFYDSEGDNYYHFVFGLNVEEKDYNNVLVDEGIEYCFIDVYISELYTKDKKVYDFNNNLIGYVENYVGSNKIYGQNQYFYDIINNKEDE